MDFYSVRNLVILGLFQIGVIVLSVLSAGASVKWRSAIGLPGSDSGLTLFYCEWGWLLLLLPILWMAYATNERYKHSENETRQLFVLVIGLLLLLILLILGWKAGLLTVFRSLVGITGSSHGLSL
jgi:hypothetical protein